MSQESGTPSAWKAGNLAYGAGLTLDTARKMLDAGEKEAEKHGVPVAMAIVDAGGNLLAVLPPNAHLVLVNAEHRKGALHILVLITDLEFDHLHGTRHTPLLSPVSPIRDGPRRGYPPPRPLKRR